MNTLNPQSKKYRAVQMAAPLIDVLGWDIVNWSQALVLWEKVLPYDISNCRFLEIGAYSGGLSLWIAQKKGKIICSDFESPERRAIILHKKWKIENAIFYEAIDATSIPYENEFDFILFKSVLGAIGSQNHLESKKKAISEMHKALKPGGVLLYAENLEGSLFHRFFRKKYVRWGNTWSYASIDEIKTLMGVFRENKFETTGFLGAFGRTHFQRNFLGILDQLIFCKLINKSNHYIIYGYAKK